MFKALVIQDSERKFRDLGDVLAVARAEGKKIFKCQTGINVVRVWRDEVVGWVVVICPDEGRSSPLVVSGGVKNGK